jgi:hypothetical protein
MKANFKKEKKKGGPYSFSMVSSCLKMVCVYQRRPPCFAGINNMKE